MVMPANIRNRGEALKAKGWLAPDVLLEHNVSTDVYDADFILLILLWFCVLGNFTQTVAEYLTLDVFVQNKC